mgnify:CR=1 FL=1
MKKKPRQKLTPLQQKRLLKISAILLLAAIVWLFFAPDMGLLSWREKQSEFQQLQERKVQLEKENDMLRQEIERIEGDIEYFEKLAREKHGLLKKNEVLFDFSKDKKKKEK